MNLIIGIAILLVLMLSDAAHVSSESSHLLERLAGVLLLTLVPVAVAAIQVIAVRMKDEAEQTVSQQLATARVVALIHALVWFVASMAIINVAKWHEVVRVHWEFDRFVLVDDFLILLPMIFSLILSWAIFFDESEGQPGSGLRIKERLEYVGLRCQVYLLVVLVPIALIMGAQDLWPWIRGFSPFVIGAASVALVLSILCSMPLIVRLLWRNRPISDDEGRVELLDVCRIHGMTVKDIRVWETGNRVMNALVTGLIPRLRVLMVSDLLLHTFPMNELKAILRHEAGHIRLNHLPIRVGFVILPALAMVAVEMDRGNALSVFLAQAVGDLPVDPSLILGLGFITYVLCISAWLSKNMEFEADLYSVGLIGSDHEVFRDAIEAGCPGGLQAMADALFRFGEQNPDQFHRGSVTHPSLHDRIEMIRGAANNPQIVKRFRRRFTGIQIGIALIFPLLTGLIIWL